MADTPTMELLALDEGAAIAVMVTVPADAVSLRIIRRSDGIPADESDVGEGRLLYSGHPSGLDSNGLTREYLDFGTIDDPLIDGKTYSFGVFTQDVDGAWSTGATDSIAAATGIELRAIDPAELILQRLPEKLLRLMSALDQAGRLRFPEFTAEQRAEGLPVYEAFPFEQTQKWPCWSVHLDKDSTSVKFIGQGGVQSSFEDRQVEERAAPSNVIVHIIGWSNTGPEERRAMRKLIRAAMYEDALFYERAGLSDLVIDGPADAEDFGMGVPIYNVVVTITCETIRKPTITRTQQIVSAETRALVLVDAGLLTSATSTTLTDSSKTWQAAQWTKGLKHVVRITSTGAAGQQRVISANTVSQLTIADAWDDIPSAGAAYQIYRVFGVQTDGTAEYQNLG